MRKQTLEFFLESQIPDSKALCLCGSGHEFGKCCLSKYKFEINIPRSEIQEDTISNRTSKIRAEITRYSIWHRQQTIPLAQASFEAGEEWMTMDIAALGDMVGRLLYSYQEMNKLSEFVAVLERLRANINDPRWQRKITYFQAFTLMVSESDLSKAKTELLKLAPFENEEDPEVLQLYLDMFRDSLSFGERQNHIKQLLLVTKKAGDRLQYECLRAVDHFLINDVSSAKTYLDTAISNYRLSPEFSQPSVHTKCMYASVLELHGTLLSDESSTEESIKIFLELTKNEDFTAAGRANIYRQLGEIYRSRGRYELAQVNFKNAIEEFPFPICQIFLASTLIATAEFDEARDILCLVDRGDLTPEEDVDYAFIWAELAHASNRREDCEKALAYLREITTAVPYFVQLRDEMIIALLDQKVNGQTKNNYGVWEKIAVMTKYLNLKPSFFGVGIDINKFIADKVDKKIK